MTVQTAAFIAAFLLAAFTLRADDPELVERTSAALQEPMDEHLKKALEQWHGEMQSAETTPAVGKLPLVMQSLRDPWTGLADAENTGQSILRSARSIDGQLVESLMGDVLPLLDEEPTTQEPKAVFHCGFPLFSASGKDALEFLLAAVEEAHLVKEKAIAGLSPAEREFLATWPRDGVRLFEVHLFGNDPAFLEQYGLTGKERAVLRGAQRWAAENDLRFIELVREKINWQQMGKAAAILARLADPQWQEAMAAYFADAQPLEEKVVGVEGELLHVAETPAGRVIIGGAGDNTYSFRVSPAAVIDLGGNNSWLGALASSREDKQSNAVIVSLGNGRNEFHGGDFGLATGTLGVGLLLAGDGDNFYHARDGGGGVGLGGIGLLIDRGGANRYVGGRFSLGSSLGGIGLLVSQGENEEFEGRIYSVGFGGPGGVGIVVRTGGAAKYRAGNQDASGYNTLTIQPGDAGFQLEAFSLGCGSGKRIFSPDAEEAALSLAGGVGMLLETDGDSTYQGTNFALGCGYFFGLGLVLDGGGDDHFTAARYGMAAGAHYGVGLFLNKVGHDRYESTGPTYNCGAAWDRTVALFVDGDGDDQYDLMRSAGLGISQHSSWAVATDLAGSDTYKLRSGLGASGAGSPAVFADFDSPNKFEEFPSTESFAPSDSQSLPRPPAGLFLSSP